MNRTCAAVLRVLHLPCCAPRGAASRAAEAEGTDEVSAEVSAAAGCGWFDSSHELSCGLLVTEHVSPDAVAAELPLGGWIDLHLAGWRPQLQPGAA